MSVQPEDRTTIDMFTQPKKGRPKTNPFDRNIQLRVSKRNQRERDKQNGLRRVEVKLSGDVIDVLDELSELSGRSRADVIEAALVNLYHEQEDLDR